MLAADRVANSQEKLERLFTAFDKKELKENKHTPLYRLLITQLEKDYWFIHQCFDEGRFSAESTEGTAQLKAQAEGQLDAITSIVNFLNDITTGEEE